MRLSVIILPLTILLSACATTTDSKTNQGNSSLSSAGKQSAASIRNKKKNRITYEDLPEFARQNFMLGSNYLNSGELDAAEEKLLEVAKLSPNYPDVYNSLGFLEESRGKKTNAIAFYSKAVSLDNHYGKAFANIARVQCREDDKSAPTNLEALAQSSKANLQAGLYAGAAGCAIVTGNPNQAITLADKAIAADASYPESYYFKAQASFLTGNYTEVLRVLEIYHDLQGYSPYSTRIGWSAAKALNNSLEIQKYENIIARYDGK